MKKLFSVVGVVLMLLFGVATYQNIARAGNGVTQFAFADTTVSDDPLRLDMVDPQDVTSLGEFKVFIIRGASAKRLANMYQANCLVDTQHKIIIFLQTEA